MTDDFCFKKEKKEMHRDNKWTRPSTTSPTPNNPHKTNVQMHFL